MGPAGTAVVVSVVVLRLVVPLSILRWPLPGILAALVIDAVDQTLFTSLLSASDWAQIAGAYQGYDKALDVYALTVAYIATKRNWTNVHALRWAEGLWLYRLVGVVVFQVLHSAAAPDSWRWLLFVFPNTFEYFFIAYEVVRVRWDPARLSARAVAGMAVVIWVVVKLPQEWWIHVAQLDFTDVAARHTWVWPTLGGLAVLAIVALRWLMAHRFPPADWPPRLAADPLPEPLATGPDVASYRAGHWRALDSNLLVKVVLTTLVCVNFGEILPGNEASAGQIAEVIAAVVVLNSVVSLALARRRNTVEHMAAELAVTALLNVAILVVLRALSQRFVLDHALFFALLISLIVALYDRYRPVRSYRIAAAELAVPIARRGSGAMRPPS